ncbi:phosphatidylinositol transfer domain-containing protein [Plasmodium vivax Brazil I]|uniref:Phosphatidylinositol transfer domain-containing protein n=1 Tax=Plasmodium vivax (strain Brazil I) TaxID=1033975 RepID=A0A0J9VFC0_PLAV1|nr:phosphatidylinositol transfer domain-containing protein [Plasmodium vivax Brazil I]
MKLIEFRLAMPLTMEEYKICQQYLLAKVSHEDTENTIHGVGHNKKTDGRSLVLFKKGTYDDENGEPGDYTFKRMNLVNKIPKWLLNFVDPKYCLIDEKSWNSYPYLKTVYEATGFPKAQVQVESTHHIGYNTEDNAFNISDEQLAQRKVVLIDIVNDKVAYKDYLPEEDPTIFYSERAQRGKLDENWIENSKVIMTCYKLFNIDIPYFGMFCSKLENWIVTVIKDSLLKYHRKALSWIDEWIDLTDEQIRAFEAEIQNKLEGFWKEVGLDVETDSSVAVQFMADRQANTPFAQQPADDFDDGEHLEMDQASIDAVKSDPANRGTACTPLPPTDEHSKFPGSKVGRGIGSASGAPSGESTSASELAEKSGKKSKDKKKKKKKKKKKGADGEEGSSGKKSSKSKDGKKSKKKKAKGGEAVEAVEAVEAAEAAEVVEAKESAEPSESQGSLDGGASSKLRGAAAPSQAEEEGSSQSLEAGEEAEATDSSALNVEEGANAQKEQTSSSTTTTAEGEAGQSESTEKLAEGERPKKTKKSKGKSSKGKSSKEEGKKKKSDKSLSSSRKEEGLAEVEEEVEKSRTLVTPSDTKIRSRVLREVHNVDDEDILLTEEGEAAVMMPHMAGGKHSGDSVLGKKLNGGATQMGADLPWKLHHVFVTRNKMGSLEGRIMSPFSAEDLKRFNVNSVGNFKGGENLLMVNPFTERRCTNGAANNGEGEKDMFFPLKSESLWEEGRTDLFTPIDVDHFYARQGGNAEGLFFNVGSSAMEDSQMMGDQFAENMESMHNGRRDMSRKDSDISLAIFYTLSMLFFVYSSMSIYKRFRSLFYFLLSAVLCACAFVYYEYWNQSCFGHGNVHKFYVSNFPASLTSVTSFLSGQRREQPREEIFKTLYKLNKATLNFASNSLNAQFQGSILSDLNEILSSQNGKYAQYVGSLLGKK